MKKVLLVAGAVILVLAVVLYLLHPLGPVFLLLSLLVQVPLVWGITRANFKKGYQQRAEGRRELYAEDGDAEAWLAGEEKEARSVGYQYWSKAGRQLNMLNRADAMAAAGKPQEAAALLQGMEPDRLEAPDRKRYAGLMHKLQN